MIVYEHVIFDLDGTLVDSRADLVEAVNHVLRSVGRAEIEPTTLYRYVGDGARVLIERALGTEAQDEVPRGMELFLAYYGEHLLDATRPYPGIVEAVAALAARGIVLSVLTNKPVALSRAILGGLGLGDRFVDVIGGDSLPVRKPDPAGVERLRGRTGTARERTLLVGDSPVDLRTARAANIAFCGVGWGLAPDVLRAAGPERVIAHPADLVRLVSGE